MTPPKPGFPFRLFALAFVLSVAAALIGVLLSWQMHQRVDEMVEKHIAITKNVGRIMLLDEALTMSARMAAATGDMAYEKRYERLALQLTKAISAVRALLPQGETAYFVGRTDAANTALVNLERQAFALAHQGRAPEARALLASDEYAKLKDAYSDGMQKTIEAVDSMIASDDRKANAFLLASVAASILSVLIFGLTWFLAVRSAKSWVQGHERAQDTLRESEARFRSLTEMSSDWYWEQDKNLCFTRMSKPDTGQSDIELDTFLGHTRRDAPGIVWDEPELTRLEAITAARQTFRDFEIGRCYRNGPKHFMRMSGEPMFDASGAFEGYRGVGTDITERKQAELARRESEEQFRTLAENLPLGLALVAADGTYEFVNSVLTRITGYQAQDIPTGKAWFAKAFPDEAYRRGVVAQWKEDLRTVEQGASRQREYSVTCKDGSKKIILFWPVMMSDGRQSILYEDVTERKHTEAQRAQLEVQLRESQKMEAIGTLAGGIAHDFNNILATILGNVELTRQDVSSNPRALESLEEIRKAGTRARNLVQQILSFGRRQATERRLTTLAPIVEESGRMLRATLPARLALEVHCDADVPAVLADTTQIQQILINLATNSMQAIRSGPGRIGIRLDAVMLDAALADTHPALRAMHQQHPGRALRLAVSDDGPGMDAITLARAFEPFFTTKPVNEGTGLGLSVVYGIVQGHEGAIVVDSAPGKGSTFTLYRKRRPSTVLRRGGIVQRRRGGVWRGRGTFTSSVNVSSS